MWTDLRTLVTLQTQLLSENIMAKKKSFVAIGTALGAVLAAGAAAYFFTQTKSGKQAAKKIKTSAVSLSREISQRVQAAKKLSQKKYNEIVEQVVDEYAVQKKVGKHTVVALKRDLKTHWRDVKCELKKK